MAAIDWCKVAGQKEFDRVVEALFVNENADLGPDAYAVNGVGGDKGIDIHIRRDGRLTIVQLKFFPEGFSGGWRTNRQRQIRDSFDTALQHEPDEWWLVVPTTLKPGERTFVNKLVSRRLPGMTTPTVAAFDQTKLDILAARHPDIVAYFQRDELAEAAKTYRIEDALLTNQKDVMSLVSAVAAQAEKMHPDWKLVPFTEDGMLGTRLVAKHANAAERSPITIRVTAAFTEEHADLRRQFEQMMGYGTPGRLDLPAAVVTSFEVDGPEFIAERSENVEVTWVPKEPKRLGIPFSATFHDGDSRTVASYSGKTTWTGRAKLGSSVHAEFFGGAVTLRVLLPYDRDGNVTLSASIALGGCDPSDVVKAIDLLERIDQGAAVTLALDGAELDRLLPSGNQSVFGDLREVMLTHRVIAADLMVLQDATSQYFGYPDEVDPVDRVFVRCLRLMVEGRCVVMPDIDQLNQTLNGDDGQGIRALLAQGPHALRGEIEDFVQEVFGHQFHLGAARMYAPQVEVVEAESLLAALDQGTAAGRRLTLRALPGHGFWLYLPDKLITEEDDRIRPVSLGLPDVVDAPDVTRALEASVAE